MNSTFCTDLVSLYVNHIFDCDPCFDKTIGLMFIIFVFFALLFVLINGLVYLIEKLISKIFDVNKYKDKYIDLCEEYSSFKEEYEVLQLEYEQLEKEYYHTCN